MWGELLAAIELLAKTLSSEKFEQRKLRGLAKRLVTIYLNIERLVEQGSQILFYLRHDTALRAKILFDQLKTMQSLLDDLKDVKLESFLQIKLPETASLDFWIDVKWQFLEGIQVDLGELAMRPYGSTGHGGLPISSTTRLRDLWNEMRSSKSRESKQVFVEHFLYPLDNIHEVLEQPLWIRASEGDIELAQATLSQIKRQGEALRTFIANNFSMGDLLHSVEESVQT
jgi:hypothetical protein